MTGDVIDTLVGIEPGSRLDAIRAQRPQARDNAQRSFLALFAPADPAGVSLDERHALAVFVATLHAAPDVAAFYRARMTDAALAATAAAEGARGATHGPYGRFPPGPLAGESRDGKNFLASAPGRLGAGFTHAHMLVFRPREAAPEHLQALLDAGWSTSDIVTLSQLVAFLAFQIRVIAGLAALAATEAA